MILNDDLVTLRAIELEDAEILCSLINNPEIERSVFGWSFPVSLEEQKKWILGQKNNNSIRYSVVVEKATVGMASISDLDLKNRTANLNIKLIEEARGKGIAFRSIKLLMDYCYDELNLFCLTANVIDTNENSKKLWTKLGFTIDGILRSRLYKNGEYHNVIAFSMLRNEYDRNRK